jgi:hypothetical protein
MVKAQIHALRDKLFGKLKMLLGGGAKKAASPA